MKTFVCVASASVALALGAAGCGRAPGLYPVEGKALYKGEPAGGAAVYFHRKGGPPPVGGVPTAVTGPDGSFRLAGEAGDGAAPGAYDVLVEWRDPAAPKPVVTRASGKAGANGKRSTASLKTRVGRLNANRPADRLDGRFFTIDRPRLHAEVKPEANTLPPFELGGL